MKVKKSYNYCGMDTHCKEKLKNELKLCPNKKSQMFVGMLKKMIFLFYKVATFDLLRCIFSSAIFFLHCNALNFSSLLKHRRQKSFGVSRQVFGPSCFYRALVKYSNIIPIYNGKSGALLIELG